VPLKGIEGAKNFPHGHSGLEGFDLTVWTWFLHKKSPWILIDYDQIDFIT